LPEAVELLSDLIEAESFFSQARPSRFELLSDVRKGEVEALEQFFSALSWVPVAKRWPEPLANSHIATAAPTATSSIPTI
jgi:hypothetical protein